MYTKENTMQEITMDEIYQVSGAGWGFDFHGAADGGGIGVVAGFGFVPFFGPAALWAGGAIGAIAYGVTYD